jgi:hypothetical protein
VPKLIADLVGSIVVVLAFDGYEASQLRRSRRALVFS